MEAIYNFDSNILLYIQENIRTDILNSFFITFTKLGNGGILWIALALTLLCFKRTRKVGLVISIALLIGTLITNVTLKNLVARTRPFYTIADLQTLIAYPTDYSFPSGHTTSAFASCTSLFIMLDKRYSFLFLVFATLMGFSRLYVGVHYPTDVFIGLIVGVLSAIISFYIIKYLYLKYSKDVQQN